MHVFAARERCYRQDTLANRLANQAYTDKLTNTTLHITVLVELVSASEYTLPSKHFLVFSLTLVFCPTVAVIDCQMSAPHISLLKHQPM